MMIHELIKCPMCPNEALDTSEFDASDPRELRGRLRCPQCGFVMETDRGVLVCVEPEKLSSIDRRNQVVYQDIWSRGYEVYREENVTDETKLLEKWRDYFDVDVLLDAGCGAGRLLEVWVGCDARLVVFVDVSDAIFQCRENWLQMAGEGANAVFIKASVKMLPLRDRAVDSVWCAGTIACTDDQQTVLQELLRVGNHALVLGTITEKTLAGKAILLTNALGKLFKRFTSPAHLFALAGGLAWLAYPCIWCICFFGKYLQPDAVRDLQKIIACDRPVARLQYTFFDPLAAPTGRKFADSFYIDLARAVGFVLRKQTTSSVCDYYEFVR